MDIIMEIVSSQVDRIVVYLKNEIDTLIEKYEDEKNKYVETIHRLENEMKNRPHILNIPPLKIVVNQEA